VAVDQRLYRGGAVTELRADLALIAAQVPSGARVLDVGCGDGALLAALRDGRGADARGLELDAANVAAAMAQGLAVVQGDADRDLADYPGDSFDVAILSQTLQTTHRPDRVVGELLRIAPRAFVSFPNFAHWRVRLSLLWNGRMPVTRELPVSWYETPNIHHLTVRDFQGFVADRGLTIDGAWYLANGQPIGAGGANWRAEQAVFALRRS
jgi:methionine biosynthesis protein MetW